MIGACHSLSSINLYNNDSDLKVPRYSSLPLPSLVD